MSRVVLGTAGHVDHGKTSLVKALTGVDTDRLKAEKERGITIELGFASLMLDGPSEIGVVDVPGHEAFVRTMVAGATGMDIALLVVAGDESVMPQTREHLAIVELLGVQELVVAVTKCDTVDDDWLTLVEAEVRELLARTRYPDAPIVRTSASTGAGLDALRGALAAATTRVGSASEDDLVRLPLDRVFTIQGTGTVVTGTLWSGRLRTGDRVRVLPGGLEGRVRGVQVHDRDVGVAEAGARTAVALAGDGVDRHVLQRGATIVNSPAWTPSRMLTAQVRLLDESTWTLAHNQRVRLHLGTSEVLARCVLLEGEELGPADSGWIQLRLEEPLAARARDRFILRAYSPVATIGGGRVAETHPPKRSTLDDATRKLLAHILDGGATEALEAYLELRGWQGASVAELPIVVGLAPGVVEGALHEVERSGALRTVRTVFAPGVRAEGEGRILQTVTERLTSDPLCPCVPLTVVRAVVPRWAGPELADALVNRMVDDGRLQSVDGGVSLPGRRPALSVDQEAAVSAIARLLAEGDLSAPEVAEYPSELLARPDLWALLKHLEGTGRVRVVAEGLFLDSGALDRAEARIMESLGGRGELGPADFKEALPVTRRRLLPLLNYFDGRGVTLRRGEAREVRDATNRRPDGV